MEIRRILALSSSAEDVIYAPTGKMALPGGPHHFHKLAVSSLIDESTLSGLQFSWATSADPARVSIYPDEDRAEIRPGSGMVVPAFVETEAPDGVVVSLVDASEFSLIDNLPFLMSTPSVFLDANGLFWDPTVVPRQLIASHDCLVIKGTETEMAGLERYLSDNESSASTLTTYGPDGFEFVSNGTSPQAFTATVLPDCPPWFARGAGDVLLMALACAVVAGLGMQQALEAGQAAAESLIKSRLA